MFLRNIGKPLFISMQMCVIIEQFKVYVVVFNELYNMLSQGNLNIVPM